ncbi:MAG: DUF1963 domain-containing protein [Propionibacteriaceae bacterium]|nr:DUF1963 domain-containing protein [Propionibacteriaceae bacterium]
MKKHTLAILAAIVGIIFIVLGVTSLGDKPHVEYGGITFDGITLLLIGALICVAGLLNFLSSRPTPEGKEPSPSWYIPSAPQSVSDVDKAIQELGITMEEIKQYADTFVAKTSLPCIVLSPVRRATGVLDSKFGGTPYLPPGFNYPHNENPDGPGQPLKLLAQLNFSTLPQVDWGDQNIPTTGILQFYITKEMELDGDLSIFGADIDDPHNQQGFRVVYHRSVIEDPAMWQDPPAVDDLPGDYFPFEGELAIEAKATMVGMTPSDHLFAERFSAEMAIDLPEEQYDILQAAVIDYLLGLDTLDGHRIGGYPLFFQNDPREFDPVDAPTLLLQMDTDADDTGDTYDIMWGDAGIAHFFAGVEDFATCDDPAILSTAAFSWECM